MGQSGETKSFHFPTTYHPPPTSRWYKNRIADEVEPDAMRRLAIVEIGGNRFSHLLLKITQVFALRRDPTGLAGGVPPRDQPPRR